MGINKGHFEAESNTQQIRYPLNSNISPRTKKQRYLPGLLIAEAPDNMPLPKLIQLIWLRLRRRLLALRFQANRWSFRLAKPNNAFKLCALACAGYLAVRIDPNSENWDEGITPISDYAVETKLIVGGEEEYKPKPTSFQAKNEAAPVSVDELFREQTLDYIERFHKIAIGEMQQFGIPASISLAQGLIESRAGTSKLAKSNNNHFGIKCFSKKCKKGHCSNFTDDTHKDFFRKFQSPWESWRAHSQLLVSGRYAKLRRHGRDYRAWAFGLKSVGYATDRIYAEKLIGIIERHGLNKYDR